MWLRGAVCGQSLINLTAGLYIFLWGLGGGRCSLTLVLTEDKEPTGRPQAWRDKPASLTTSSFLFFVFCLCALEPNSRHTVLHLAVFGQHLVTTQ